ncbi:MAG: hypothetical protein U0228_38465 [Myxococcaceae bacterium]
MPRLVLALLVTASVSVGAQTLDDGGLPDAGLPDASVGSGGPDMTNEENDNTGAPCLSSTECTGATACVNGRCVPTKTKTVGCSAADAAGLVVPAVVLAFALRRRRLR